MDVIILAQPYSFFGERCEESVPAALPEIFAFHWHGLYLLGPDASMELIDEAQLEISSIASMLNPACYGW